MQFDTPLFGSHVVRFGDLDGNGDTDILFAQTHARVITCLTATTLQGEILWQVGTANARHFSAPLDVPVQIIDWDQDGTGEVFYIQDGLLRILKGEDGALIQQISVPAGASDSIFFYSTQTGASPDRVLIKNRYDHVWVYDHNLNFKWDSILVTGHFPIALDVEGDGQNEILIGYTLLRDDAALVWERNNLGLHADSTDVGDIDNDGEPEILIAPSGTAAVLNADGSTRFEMPYGEAQHSILGNFDPHDSDLEIVLALRGPRKAGRSSVECLKGDGERVASINYNTRTIIISAVDGWGEDNQSQVLVSRTPDGIPELVNCQGEVLFRLNLPGAKKRPSQLWRGAKHFTFAQHLDLFDDSREEIIVYSEKKVWVFKNQDAVSNPPQSDQSWHNNPRIFNATFYVGMQ